MLGLMSDGSKPRVKDENGKVKREYGIWYNMIQRCYNPKTQERYPTYKGCSVCERWLVFSQFLEDIKSLKGYDKWVNDNTYELDKDLLQQDVPNNEKVYSPETCCFIPQSENVREMAIRTGLGVREPEKVYGVDIRTGEKTKVFKGICEVEKELGIHRSSISRCLNGERKSAGKYKWFKVE